MLVSTVITYTCSSYQLSLPSPDVALPLNTRWTMFSEQSRNHFTEFHRNVWGLSSEMKRCISVKLSSNPALLWESIPLLTNKSINNLIQFSLLYYLDLYFKLWLWAHPIILLMFYWPSSFLYMPDSKPQPSNTWLPKWNRKQPL